MNPNREEVLFALALEKPAEKRAAFLEVMCEGDSALHARLEALLAAHERPETLATQAESARPTLQRNLIMKYRHRVLGFLCLLAAITYLDRVAISVAGPRMQESLHISPEAWG